MWGGLLWSRALLSISVALFIFLALLSGSLREQWTFFKNNPYLYLMSLLFLVPFLSGLWSENRDQWLKIILSKAPLLAFPLCCYVLYSMKKETTRKLVYLALVTTFISMSKTILQFFLNAREISETYLQAKVLPVDMSNDHVRYAWLLVLLFAWMLHLLTDRKIQISGKEKKGILFYLVFTAIFLHLLASKTGIIGLYLVIGLALICHFRLPMAKWLTAVALLMPVLAWVSLPTFRNRLKFVWWDFQHYSRGGYAEGLSDTPRILSIDAGKALIKEHPVMGTGFGDLQTEITVWYTRNIPYLKGYEQLLPSNEGLIYAVGAGLIGFMIFLTAVLYPFSMRNYRSDFSWISFHALAIFGFIYEIGLETQYGIFIYAFLGCWLFMQLKESNVSADVDMQAAPPMQKMM